MAQGDRRKCRCCRKLFHPDPRNRRHQRYCSAPACRAASKAASQARWLAAPENQDYFRGPMNLARVREWRSRHRGYWRKKRRAGTFVIFLHGQASLAPPANERSVPFAAEASHYLNSTLSVRPSALAARRSVSNVTE